MGGPFKRRILSVRISRTVETCDSCWIRREHRTATILGDTGAASFVAVAVSLWTISLSTPGY